METEGVKIGRPGPNRRIAVLGGLPRALSGALSLGVAQGGAGLPVRPACRQRDGQVRSR